VPDSDITVLTF